MQQRLLSTLRSVLAKGASSSALTARGAIAFSGGALLIIAAYFDNDLAGSVVGPTLALLIVTLIGATWWYHRANIKNGSVSLAVRQPTRERGDTAANAILAAAPISISFSFSGASIPPTFMLDFSPRFVQAGLSAASGDDAAEQVVERLTLRSLRSSGAQEYAASGAFPHRGNWAFQGAHVSLSDPLTFVSAEGFLQPQHQTTFRVEPPQELFPWSVISSVERAGDALQLSNERLGARLDLKTYHPADGMRSIAWKIFARRGELLARHPEAAATPDGTVVLFVAATKLDDATAGAAVSYASRCEELGSNVFAGVLGSEQLATSASQMLELSIEHAFDATPNRLAADVAALLRNLGERAPHTTIKRIAIVVPEGAGSELRSELGKVAQILNNSRVTGTLLVVPKSRSRETAATAATNLSGLQRWFFAEDDSAKTAAALDGNQSTSEAAAQLGFEIGAAR